MSKLDCEDLEYPKNAMVKYPNVRIIAAYVATKRDAFETFIADCERLQSIQEHNPDEVHEFISDLLRPNVDARIFEIVSYAILKPYYVMFFASHQDKHKRKLKRPTCPSNPTYPAN